MERITYILGAGFSAPLGLPVMRDFLIKSKDLYFSDTDRYQHFLDVFDLINKLSVAKNYFDTDLFNIEEILSIIEMQQFVEQRRMRRVFSRYVCDVISHYTPPILERTELPGNWQDFVFGKRHSMQSNFGYFVGSLFGLSVVIINDNRRTFRASTESHPDTPVYSVVTLNYDMVLENTVAFVNRQYEVNEPIGFDSDPLRTHANSNKPTLAKLHGSVETRVIVPPTWAKGTHRRIAPVWKKAYEIIKESTQLRFIGYSLPVGDDYIKYLLKAAVVTAPHLKKIDVICRDASGRAQRRYEDFIKFGEFRFRGETTERYLMVVEESYQPARRRAERGGHFRFDSLEPGHERFMSGG